ncbi:GGDEF domain-containing protein [Erythrobacter ani]|uniref:diguanylate cyclase n=1 Tax=Erythrobacter ani TaxID=2827235 RepID=A0ABS6SHW9_9SPHN|nr:GGDEF domain-containing protein [Erythrobacter ani]MBV7264614.1 GGDEF domain-containing protein [Erythrobacter ani]
MQTQILGLLTPLMALVFAATFAALWRFGRLKRHVLGFAISYLLFAAGFLSTHLLPPDAVYLFHTTQAFYSLGAAVFLASLCDRVGQRVHLGSFAAVYLISAAALTVAVSVSNEVGARLIIVNTGYGVMFAMAVTTLLSARRKTMIDTAIIAVMAVQAADFLVRPNMTLMFEQSIAAAAYRDSIYYSLIGLVLGVKSVATAILLIGASVAEWTTSLRETGERDDLTGLRNRGAFEDAMRTLLPQAQSQGRALSLVVADIDHFKQVNDIWGHQAGDAAIREFANLIGRMVRGCDVTARIGGEEFCIAVWDCEESAAQRLAERIRSSFARTVLPGMGEDMRLTASFGVVAAKEGEAYSRLFARADAALYRAKESGRDKVVVGSDEPRLNQGAWTGTFRRELPRSATA